MGSQERSGNGGGDREAILMRRAAFVASALGGLGLTAPRVADGQELSPTPSTPRTTSGETAPRVCLSLQHPKRPQGHRVLTGVTSELWLPLDALGDEAQRPPLLLGGWIHLGSPLTSLGSVELRAVLVGGFFSSSRGWLFPAGGQLQAIFSTIPGGFSVLTLGGGWLLGTSSYGSSAGEWKPAERSTFLEGAMVPFGFRFGRESRGELGLRFAALTTKVAAESRQRYAFAFVSSGAWLTYLF
ncbi:MAG: hypothetical protein RMJ98_12140 [Myxococcales bacterium]|nr:hypothetical protein [Polyangiaceae bacterium]MDW8250037.1 hypothetical protein [Myxococcales bacterium]